MPIRIARGQRKTILAEYFQAEEDGPRMDLTSALFTVSDSNFSLPVGSILFETVDLAQGTINVVVTAAASSAMRVGRINWFTVKCVIGTWEDVSDPIEFEVTSG